MMPEPNPEPKRLSRYQINATLLRHSLALIELVETIDRLIEEMDAVLEQLAQDHDPDCPKEKRQLEMITNTRGSYGLIRNRLHALGVTEKES